MALEYYSHKVADTNGSRLSGATVFVVPYVPGRDSNSVCSLSDALTVYGDEFGGFPKTIMTSDSNGEANFYIEEGEYAICTTLGQKSYTDPHVCIYCPKPEEAQPAAEDYQTTITVNPIFKHTIQHNGNIQGKPDVCVLDSSGDEVFPACDVIDENTIQLCYSDDCPQDTHTVIVKNCIQANTMSGSNNNVQVGTVDVVEILCKFQDMAEKCIGLAAGQALLKFKVNGVPVEVDAADPYCINIMVDDDTITTFPGIPVFLDDDGNKLLPKIKINNVEGSYDALSNCLNFTLPPQITITDGGSGLVTPVEGGFQVGPMLGCDNTVIQASEGQIQTCARIPVCGYVGDPICDDVVLGDVDLGGATQNILFEAGDLAGVFRITQTAPGGSVVVGTPTVNGTVVSVPMELTGNAKVGYNVLVDKFSLPSIDGCTPPVSGFIEIDGLVGEQGNGAQITKAIGDTVTVQNNMLQITGSVFEAINNAPTQWRDDIAPNLFGGDPANMVGSTSTGEVQVFDGSVQNIIMRFEVCWSKPAVAYTDTNGVYLDGMDSDGNDVVEGDFISLD